MSNATAKQIDFIAKLVAERAEVLSIPDPAAFVSTLNTQRITKQGASALIEKLLATKVPVAPAAATPSPDARGSLPSNRYGGKCVLCGVQVAAGAGTYRRNAGRWETLHLPGQCPAVEPKVSLNDIIGDVPDGYYAIPCIGESGNDLTFFRVSTNQGRVNPSNKGRRYVGHVVGGHGEIDHVSDAWVTRAIEALRAFGIAEAAALYGQKLGHCGICGRTLTDEESRARGIGPTCAAGG